MEAPSYYAPPLPSHSDSSRLTLGFPLGTALLLIVIFSLCGVFSCCYHWDKLRYLRGSFADTVTTTFHRSSLLHHSCRKIAAFVIDSNCILARGLLHFLFHEKICERLFSTFGGLLGSQLLDCLVFSTALF